jgi:predicted GNAT family acetyltransferase
MDTSIDHERTGTGGRYRLVVDGADAGELDHRDVDGRRVFTHTGVRTEFEGRGLAAQLVRRGLDGARSDGMKVVPQCSYVAAYIARHPDDIDLLATAD